MDEGLMDAVIDNMRDVLEAWGTQLVDDMTAILEKEGKNVSGALLDSLAFKITESSTGLKFKINPKPYADYIDKGVKGSKKNQAPKSPYKFKKQPPSGVIQMWIGRKKGLIQKIAKKGIPTKKDRRKLIKPIKSAAFLIARSIKQKGFKPVPFWTDVVTEERQDDLKAALELALGRTVEVSFDNIKLTK